MMTTRFLLFTTLIASALAGPSIPTVGQKCLVQGDNYICASGLDMFYAPTSNNGDWKCFCVYPYANSVVARSTQKNCKILNGTEDPLGKHVRCLPGSHCEHYPEFKDNRCKWDWKDTKPGKLGEACAHTDNVAEHCEVGLECVVDDSTFTYPSFCLPKRV
jgi:hypothetical protein